jgi:soluble lytic murein transglycosylase
VVFRAIERSVDTLASAGSQTRRTAQCLGAAAWRSITLGALLAAASVHAQAEKTLSIASGPKAGSEARDRAGVALLRSQYSEATREAAACAKDAAPGSEIEADCALELARARFQLGDLAAAAAALAPLEGKPGPLAAYVERLLGESLLLSGKPREAQAPLRAAIALEPAGPIGKESAALLADALFDAGDPKAAAAQAQRAAELPGQALPVKAGLAWTRVRALAQLAQGEAGTAAMARTAASAARAFWRDHPDHPAIAEEPALEVTLAKIAGGPLPAPSPRDHLIRAQHLLNDGLPGMSASEAQAAREVFTGEEHAEASLLYARALAADGRRSEAGPALEEAIKSTQPKFAAQAMLLLARDKSRRAENDAAIALLDKLAERFPASTEADEGSYLAARLQLEGADTNDGKARLFRVSQKRTTNGAEARWLLAWLAYRAQKSDAAERFAASASLASDDESKARATYWQARASAPIKAAPLFQRALELDSLGWYGLLARAQLQREAAAKPLAPETKSAGQQGRAILESAGERLGDPARHLLRIGFANEASAELDHELAEHRGEAARLLPILWGYERAGRYDRSVSIAESQLAGRTIPFEARANTGQARAALDPQTLGVLEAAYPAAFSEAVAASAKRTDLDADLILAVARRESLFKPDARSAAGAVGLLQLLPITARRAAAVMGRPAPSDRDLQDPNVAVDLGAWYLSDLLGRFKDPAIAVAAYNAGPRAVAPWVKAAVGQPLDVFVEEIPYKETRKYVKIVVGSWSAYRLLSGAAAPKLSEQVPEPGTGAAF